MRFLIYYMAIDFALCFIASFCATMLALFVWDWWRNHRFELNMEKLKKEIEEELDRPIPSEQTEATQNPIIPWGIKAISRKELEKRYPSVDIKKDYVKIKKVGKKKGKKHFKWTAPDIENARKWLTNGDTQAKVSRRLGVPVHVIYSFKKRYMK